VFLCASVEDAGLFGEFVSVSDLGVGEDWAGLA